MRYALCALLLAGAGQSVAAQARDSATAGPVLSLNDAIALARRNNPAHLQTRTARSRAGAQLRSSYGALLPSFNSTFSTGYREGRQQFFGGQAFGSTTDIISSDVGLNVTAQYSAASLMAPRVQRANLDAAEADITSSEATLRTSVATQYLNALQAQSRAVLQDTLLANTQAQLELARARESVGAATLLDVRRAEVAVGTQQVAVLRERNNVEIEKLRLFQQLGVPQPANVQLTTNFPVAEPTLQLNEILAMARRANPALDALRSRERAANLGMRQAQSLYTPTIRLATGVSGFTSQSTDVNATIAEERANFASSFESCLSQDSIRTRAGLPSISPRCQRFIFTPEFEQVLRSENEKFPFDFTRDPLNFSVTLSLPIFDGFLREQRIQEASATRSDARYRTRAQELQVTADVTAGHLNLVTAYRTVTLQEQNSQTARQALALAQERFRVGANTFVDLAQARADYERAETDRINAIYEYHKAYATLESAVGRPLR